MKFDGILVAIINDVTNPSKWHGIIEIQHNLDETCLTFLVSIVPADGLAPLGARTSAGNVLTKFRPCICTGLALHKLTLQAWIYTYAFVSSVIITSDNGILLQGCLLVTKLLPKPMLIYCQLDTLGTNFNAIELISPIILILALNISH